MEIRVKAIKGFIFSTTKSCYITINRGQIWNFKSVDSGNIWIKRQGVQVCVPLETFNKYFETIEEK